MSRPRPSIGARSSGGGLRPAGCWSRSYETYVQIPPLTAPSTGRSSRSTNQVEDFAYVALGGTGWRRMKRQPVANAPHHHQHRWHHQVVLLCIYYVVLKQNCVEYILVR